MYPNPPKFALSDLPLLVCTCNMMLMFFFPCPDAGPVPYENYRAVFLKNKLR